MYRLGATAEQLMAAYNDEKKDLDPAIPSQHFINDENWY